MPLKFLNTSINTAWLVHTILPHFSQTNSILVTIMLTISWPLMFIGLILFLIGFIQIYWAKFRRKGVVLGGLYRFIRHPQYTAWAIFGLGMVLYWSRMLVLIMYTTMLFVYFFLARREEQECINKFGDDYKLYMQRTGMFLPKLWRNKTEKSVTANPVTRLFRLPERGFKRMLCILLIYIVTIGITIGAGFILKVHVISALNLYSDENYTAISLVHLNSKDISKIVSIVKEYNPVSGKLKDLINEDNEKMLIYILPSKWNIPELAMSAKGDNEKYSSSNPILSPTTHGNSLDYDRNLYSVLFSKAIVDSSHGNDKNILENTLSQIPVLVVDFNLLSQEVTNIRIPPVEGKYSDIPVPLY